MMRSVLVLSVIAMVAAINIRSERAELVKPLTVEDVPNEVAEIEEDDPTLVDISEETNKKPEQEFDDSGLPIQHHDPNVDYGYVDEWKHESGLSKINDEGGASGGVMSASFLEEESSIVAKLVDSLDGDPETAISEMASVQSRSKQAPYHKVYQAAMADYEKKFRQHFPEPPTTPYRFQENFAAQTAPAHEHKDAEPYVLVPVPARYMQAQAPAAATDSADDSASMRFAQVRQAPVSEDGYLPFDAVTPATVSQSGAGSAVTGWNNAFGTNAGGAAAAIPSGVPGAPNFGGGLYAGGLQAPPPPPRPDNLPPPPYIRPVPQPEGGEAA